MKKIILILALFLFANIVFATPDCYKEYIKNKTGVYFCENCDGICESTIKVKGADLKTFEILDIFFKI